MKYLFIFLIFINAILADDNVSVDETYILYDYAPKNVYQNEPFKISIKFFTSRNDFDYIQTDFKEDIKVIDNNTTWVKEESFYKNTFFISIKRHNYIPEIVIKLVKTLKDTQIDEDSIFDYQTDDKNVENNITLETIILKKREIKLSKLRWLNGASHVLASELNVTDYLVEPYDNNYNQLNLYLSATKANLYDFNIKNKNIKESKLEILKNDFNHSVAIYQALIDKYTNEIKFNYFNTKKSHFEYKTLSVNINNETISTQTDINPHNNSFTNLKFVILLCILTILLIFYILNHKYIYLIMAIIVCSIMIAIKLPFKTMYIPKGTKIKILPIEKSTIFYITDKDTKAEIVKTYNHYKKIIINNKIGWMHENNLNQR